MATGASLVSTGMRSSRWPIVKGYIVSGEITKEYNENHSRTRFTPLITYSYEVNGKNYKNNRISTGDFGSGDVRDAQKVLDKYHTGLVVDVYHEPDKPENALLKPGISIISIVILLAGVIFAVSAVLGMLGIIGDKWGSAFP